MIREVRQVSLSGNTLLEGRLLSLFTAYAEYPQIARFFTGEQGAVIGIFEDKAFVICPKDDWEEVTLFLTMNTEIRTVFSTDEFLTVLLKKWGTATLAELPVMRCEKKLCATGKTVSVSPREIYPLLSTAFPQFPTFETWYLDVSFRLRHQVCHVAAVKENNITVSSAMTVAEWDTGGLLGAVATAESHRRRGLAATCVSALTEQLQQQGKAVYICPKNATAQRLYESLGFVVCDKWLSLERV